MAHRSDAETVRTTHNTSRFFVENRHISWVLLVATVLFGVYGYFAMPQRKDPEVPVRTAVALVPWPGASAERVEQLVTRTVEKTMAENARVEKIESISRSNLAVVYVELDQKVAEPQRQFDDINLRLNAINTLPAGAGPVRFIKDFGDTAALMLTVASPPASATEVALRARDVKQAIEKSRAANPLGKAKGRFSLVICLPAELNPRLVQDPLNLAAAFFRERGLARDVRTIQQPGLAAIDGITSAQDAGLEKGVAEFFRERLQTTDLHPDSWTPVIIRDPAQTLTKLQGVAGDKYSYHQLDEYTDQIEKSLKALPQVSRVNRSGVLDQNIFLFYSQERLAAYGIKPAALGQILEARNTTQAGGQLSVDGKNLSVSPSGDFSGPGDIGNVLLSTSANGAPLYLRDLMEIAPGYENPPRFLNYFHWRDEAGQWRRSRAITVAVQMRTGEKIGHFASSVNEQLEDLRRRLPPDLVVARTSDQPLQVEENVHLFMNSLMEAIVLVILVSLIGFWEWRSALLMAISIPITLAMTFGMMSLLQIDIQQVSIATLIIALGLLVDDPVVAADAIKRDLAAGHKPLIAAWLGPTKLATAIMYATVTNIVAYLPFLMLSGNVGRFLHSLPLVLACSLVASRIVSMTFIPLLGYYLLRPKAEPSLEERRSHGFAALYYRVGHWAIEHRWPVFGASLTLLVAGVFFLGRLQTQFFPKDLSYLSYVDVWLPEDAPLSATDTAVRQVEQIIQEVCDQQGREHPAEDGKPRQILQSLTTFEGGGGPRFWFSVAPEMQQLNYAQVLIQVKDKHDTNKLVEPLQKALSTRVAGARVDVQRLETGETVGVPVALRFSGDDIATLRGLAERAKTIFRASPLTSRLRDDWGTESFTVKLQTDSDRANLAGITNRDVAAAAGMGISGYKVTTLRQGDKQIPVVARLVPEERAQLADLSNLYVYSTQTSQKVPLGQVSDLTYAMQTEKIRRRNQFRTITVSAFPAAGHLPSQALASIRPQLLALQRELPPGYTMEIGGEEEKQVKGFKELALVMAVSVALIYLALVFQFKNAVKPFIVFAAIPYGMVGAVAALWVMGAPFGFMAFLGVASLVGVIVSHIIVLFDMIEEARERGEPLKLAVLDAGIVRLRPVLITVGATIIALFPLAAHGGPLWEPLCYAQIGGLGIATFITLLLVPIIYTMAVLDLKIVPWEPAPAPAPERQQP